MGTPTTADDPREIGDTKGPKQAHHNHCKAHDKDVAQELAKRVGSSGRDNDRPLEAKQNEE